MNICEQCGKEFKTTQGLGAHRVLYHRVSEARLQALKADRDLKDRKVTEFETDLAHKTEKIRILEAERQSSTCPSCGKPVGWDVQPVQWYNETKLKNTNQSLLPFLFRRRGKRCPICHYFEEVKH